MAVTDNKINNGSAKAGESRGCLAIERLKINFYAFAFEELPPTSGIVERKFAPRIPSTPSSL